MKHKRVGDTVGWLHSGQQRRSGGLAEGSGPGAVASGDPWEAGGEGPREGGGSGGIRAGAETISG